MVNTKILAYASALALAVCLALVGCGGSQPASSSTAETPEASSSSAAAESTASSSEASKPAPAANANADAQASDAYIGEDAAKEAALADAGFAEGDVTELEVELDQDDPTVHYDVDFKAGGNEYDYEIDAATGDILKSNSEVDD